ncbi:MAG TPA: hypothetical protein VFX89_16925 [Gammaproteobacteria bacterium]|nr:hypothetical protein [Gammaproteobacteria bacterium]
MDRTPALADAASRNPRIVSARILLLLATMISHASLAQQLDGLPDRDASFVAASRAFVFYSDLATNLHDFLLWNARSDRPIEPRADCLARLPDERRAALERAQELYDRTFRGNRSADRLLLAARYRLAGFTGVRLVPDEDLAPLVAAWSAAADAYEACWWVDHDARNRRWIGDLLPRLVANEDALRARLSKLYAATWTRPIPVDVVGYVGVASADSVVDPEHIAVSSVDPGNGGDSALEVVFHEASHTLFGVGRGRLWNALQRAGTASGVTQPQDFWHALLFFTTGRAVQERLEEQGVKDYEPSVYREELFTRAWPKFRAPLEREWQPYVDGRVPMDQAARRVLDALEK